MALHRGDIFILDFTREAGSSMQKRRPVLIIQNDIANQHSPYTIVAAIRADKSKQLPVQVKIPKGIGNLDKGSLVDCGHLATVLQDHFKTFVGKLPAPYMAQVDRAIKISVG